MYTITISAVGDERTKLVESANSSSHGIVHPAPAAGVRETSKRQRRRRIIEAATELLLSYSFEEITTRQVAACAGIGEATLFRYITSKRELLTLVYGDQLDAVLNRTEERDARILAETDPASRTATFYIERVFAIYRRRCDFYLLNPTNAALYLREGFDPESLESPRHLAQGDRTIRLASQVLAEGQHRGVIVDRVDAAVVAQNCHGSYIHEIDRTPVRRYEPRTIWERLEPRLGAQLLPLAI